MNASTNPQVTAIVTTMTTLKGRSPMGMVRLTAQNQRIQYSAYNTIEGVGQYLKVKFNFMFTNIYNMIINEGAW